MNIEARASPPVWSSAELGAESSAAIELFRRSRIAEPLEKYLEVFDQYRETYRELLRLTDDLREVEAVALEILGDEKLREAFRYIAGPPISIDDLQVVAEVPSLAPSRLRRQPEMAKAAVAAVLEGLDRRRFPWVGEVRAPSETERDAAVLASAAQIAAQRVATIRRNEGKQQQEARVQETLAQHGFVEVPTRKIRMLSQAPGPGEFCMESHLGTRKADVIATLWDERVLAIECKVSNSALNSIKRLNNDAAVKAETWRKEFGELQVVPAAVLSGVYKLANLEQAQHRGLTLWWAHRLDDLTAWVERTRL